MTTKPGGDPPGSMSRQSRGQAGGAPSVSSGVVGGVLGWLGGTYVEAGGGGGGGSAVRFDDMVGIAGFSIWYSCHAPQAIRPAPIA
jgi:hypothetical protein